jgi:ppGpp synthetase/RelA/SpoT-type nucleotidyltranferase
MPLFIERVDDQAREALNDAKDVLDRLLAALVLFAGPGQSPIFYHRARLKSIESIRAKVLARRHKNRTYNIADLKDIVGLRLVTLYDEEIPIALNIAFNILHQSLNPDTTIPHVIMLNERVQNAILEYRASNFEEIRRPLSLLPPWPDSPQPANSHSIAALRAQHWEAITEVRFFPRHDNDVYALGFRALRARTPFRYRSKIPELKVDETLYSSLHIQYRAPSQHNPSSPTVPVEIQIRTAIEDVWAEIGHRNGYKVRHPHIWNEDLEKKYNDLDDYLSRFKKLSNDCQDLVTSIRNTYYIAHDIRHAFKAPSSNLTFSLILMITEPLIKPHLPPGTVQLLAEYDRKFAEFDPLRDVQHQRAVLNHCISLVTDLSETFCSARIAIPQPTRDLVRRLLAFETIRLRAIQYGLPLRALCVNRPEISLREPVENISEHVLWRLYLELTTLDAEEWRTKPIVLINYWFYYILRNLYNSVDSDAWYYLISAYDNLHVDDSLPVRSIYRVLVPRGIAYKYFEEGIKLEYSYGTLDHKEGILKDNLKSLFFNAFRYGLEAWKEQRKRSGSRGDLVFGIRSIDGIFEELKLLEYGVKCIEHDLSLRIQKELQIDRDELIAVVDGLRQFDVNDSSVYPEEREGIIDLVLRSYGMLGCSKKSADARKQYRASGAAEAGTSTG